MGQKSKRLRTAPFNGLLLLLLAASCDARTNRELLRQLLHPPDSDPYDFLKPPVLDGEPLSVATYVSIVKMYPLDMERQMASFLLYFYVEWTDHRLKFNGTWAGTHIVDYEQDDEEKAMRIWLPDLEVVNVHHWDTSHEQIRIHQSGFVMWDRRVHLTVLCNMDVRWYPFDTQTCEIRAESYKWSNQYIHLKATPRRGRESLHVQSTYCNVEGIGPYRLAKAVALNESREGFGSRDVYDGVVFTFSFQRISTPYFLTHFIPLWLVVALSCFGLLIRISAAPARVSLAVTTLLVLISLNQILSRELPRVAYVIAMDVYILACLIIVLLNNAWYTLLHWLQTRIELRTEIADLRKRGYEQMTAACVASPAASPLRPPPPAAGAVLPKPRGLLPPLPDPPEQPPQPHNPPVSSPDVEIDMSGSPVNLQRSSSTSCDGQRGRSSRRRLTVAEKADLDEMFRALVTDDGGFRARGTLPLPLVESLLIDLGLEPEQARLKVAAADEDKSGCLSVDEFRELVSLYQPQMWVPKSVVVCGRGITQSAVREMDKWYCISACSYVLLLNVVWFGVVAS
eukprot:TRINITY_DN498_c4_g1_i3.p1 TRINITY_DN498_c4_g1~~TRINITY_DN498_c4_g1_i3.p1  ORF type:complete len:568 (+),score=118.50 TRINITY_DN498_c4_g1_i3:212-1915(+)